MQVKITRYGRSDKVNCDNFYSFFPPVESLTNHGGRVRIIMIIIMPIFEQGRHLQLKLSEVMQRKSLYACLAKSNADAGSCHIFNCLSYVRERCGVICGGGRSSGIIHFASRADRPDANQGQKPLPLFVFRRACKKKKRRKKKKVKAGVSPKD